MAVEVDDTEGVKRFLEFCRTVGWSYEPIPCGKKRTADLKVLVPSGLELVVEVKTLTPNPEERKQIRLREAGKVGINGCTPGLRVRRAIEDANGQLRAVAAGRPAMLFIYNDTDNHLNTEPYSMMTAMQGLDVVDLLMPSDPSQSLIDSGETRSGGKRAMTPNDNTSTSAVAAFGNFEASHLLCIYHNRHAATPMIPDTMRFPNVVHLGLPPDAKNSVEAQWVRL